jgi:serine/threonine protein kinase
MTAAATAPPTSTPRAAVQRVGRFELQRVLGRGAQATVWLGWDPKLQREVAVKMVNAGASADVITEWLAEARATSALAHPGIVPVYDADQDGEAVFLVFERVDGPTLFDKLKGMGPMPARETAELMREVLDALAFAHARGVVHRDLKPSNILVGSDGRARVMDFGIAAKLAAAHDGRIVGTPGYISPEAASGQAPAPAMDVFAAGMMLGQLLLGAHLRPIPATPQAALRQVIEQDLAWPDGKVAVDDKLRTMVMRATSRSPEGRFASAAEFRDALARWLTPRGGPRPHSSSSPPAATFAVGFGDASIRPPAKACGQRKPSWVVSRSPRRAGEISTVARDRADRLRRHPQRRSVVLSDMKDQTHAQRAKEFLAALLTARWSISCRRPHASVKRPLGAC